MCSLSFYCPQCQTPEACQVFCLYEHMQMQNDLEGEINNNISSQFTGKSFHNEKQQPLSPRAVNKLAQAVINS